MIRYKTAHTRKSGWFDVETGNEVHYYNSERLYGIPFTEEGLDAPVSITKKGVLKAGKYLIADPCHVPHLMPIMVVNLEMDGTATDSDGREFVIETACIGIYRITDAMTDINTIEGIMHVIEFNTSWTFNMNDYFEIDYGKGEGLTPSPDPVATDASIEIETPDTSYTFTKTEIDIAASTRTDAPDIRNGYLIGGLDSARGLKMVVVKERSSWSCYEKSTGNHLGGRRSSSTRAGAVEILIQRLSELTEDMWAALADVVDYSIDTGETENTDTHTSDEGTTPSSNPTAVDTSTTPDISKNPYTYTKVEIDLAHGSRTTNAPDIKNGYLVEGMGTVARGLKIVVVKDNSSWTCYEQSTGMRLSPSSWNGGLSNKTRAGALQILAEHLRNSTDEMWTHAAELVNYPLSAEVDPPTTDLQGENDSTNATNTLSVNYTKTQIDIAYKDAKLYSPIHLDQNVDAYKVEGWQMQMGDDLHIVKQGSKWYPYVISEEPGIYTRALSPVYRGFDTTQPTSRAKLMAVLVNNKLIAQCHSTEDINTKNDSTNVEGTVNANKKGTQLISTDAKQGARVEVLTRYTDIETHTQSTSLMSILSFISYTNTQGEICSTLKMTTKYERYSLQTCPVSSKKRDCEKNGLPNRLILRQPHLQNRSAVE